MHLAEKTIWREKLFHVIFEADTPAGKWFDIGLILCILASVLAVMLDSVKAVSLRYGTLLYGLEWLFTILFTIEYLLRLTCTRRPLRYAVSFFGLVDLVSIIPTYVSIILPAGKYFLVLRVLRILRVFRVLKLAQFIKEANLLLKALKNSSRKIVVFLLAVFTIVTIFGSMMYVIEGEENGFTSIPRSIYWAIVTLTTVGYGDISPKTNLGQMVAAVTMVLGYGIIAVPTGFVTVEMSRLMSRRDSDRACPGCDNITHDKDAKFCKQCGTGL